MPLNETIEESLRIAGFAKRGTGVFASRLDPRVVAIVEATTDSAHWPQKVATLLRNESFNMAPTWCRYVVLAVDAERTDQLAIAAAAFARDVSKCRRLVAFRGQDSSGVIPFLPLPMVAGGVGTPGPNLEQIVHKAIPSIRLATAFLDDQTATSHVQALAEDPSED